MNSEIKNVLMEEMAKLGKDSLSSTEILELLETEMEISEKKELEKELSNIIIRLAKIK